MKTCPLCRYEFNESDLVCHAGCPLATHCAILCCPSCGYQMVDETRSRSVALARKVKAMWLQKRAGVKPI